MLADRWWCGAAESVEDADGVSLIGQLGDFCAIGPPEGGDLVAEGQVPSGHKVDAFGNGQFGVGGVSVDTAGRTYLAGFCAHHAPTLVFHRTHRLIAKWPWPLHSPPLLGRHGEMFALACDGSILRLRITLPGA